MSSLQEALSRLSSAVARLEHAAQAREVRVARREEELNAALREARTEQARAQATADTVSQRLEAAIGRLESVLET